MKSLSLAFGLSCLLFLPLSWSKTCQILFHQYTSSPLEQKWVDNVEIWQDKVCDHITNDEISFWLGNITYLLTHPQETVIFTQDIDLPQKTPWKDVFPYATYQSVCQEGATGHKHHQYYFHIPIEPTASIVRDPRKCWEQMTEKYTQSKEYLLPLTLYGYGALRGLYTPSNIDISISNLSKLLQEKEYSKYILYDAGASVIASYQWDGTDWLYKWYDRIGIAFTNVHAWEPKKLNSDWTRLNIYPPLKQVLHFYNTGVNNAPNNPNNPIHHIKTNTNPEDLVVFKLDIDSAVEVNITKELIRDHDLYPRIHDFYFEHHVRNFVMRMHGLGTVTSKEHDLASWYKMVIPARKNGLRMHFWP